jgi:xylulose-5-phosphate/fructose-6-phosphate phosphoketolase
MNIRCPLVPETANFKIGTTRFPLVRSSCHASNVTKRGTEGTTTAPFEMVVKNDLDQFHLVQDVIERVPHLGANQAYLKQSLREKLIEHKRHIHDV